jgi:hypothetical protein
MAIVVYTKSLLEAWASHLAGSKKPRRPALEARAKASDFDPVDDDFSEDDLGDSEVDRDFGNIGRTTDYSGDSTMGYDETGVDSELDNQYSRFGMTVNEVDPATGRPASTGNTSKSARNRFTAKDFKKAVTQRRRTDAKRLYTEIAVIAAKYLGFFGNFSGEGVPEEIREIASGIVERLGDTPGIGDADSYILGTQGLIRSMEELGIAARKHNAVPEGIPDNMITAEQLSTLIYLCRSVESMVYMMRNDEDINSMNTLSTKRLAARATSINRNMAGTGTAEAPTMPPSTMELDKSSFAPWNNKIVSKADQDYADMMRKGRGDSSITSTQSTNMHAEHLTQEDSGSANAIVPHTLFVTACERIEKDRLGGMHRNARGALMKEFNGSVDTVATYLLMYGPKELKNSFGVHPPRLAGASDSACFMFRSTLTPHRFPASAACMRELKAMLTNIKAELKTKRGALVDLGGTVYDSFPVFDTKGESSAGKTIGAAEFIDNIISSIDNAKTTTGVSVKTIVSPELAYAVDRAMQLKKNARRVHVGGKWQFSNGETVPLFEYFTRAGETVNSLRMDDTKVFNGNSSYKTTGDDITYEDMQDSDSGSLKTDVTNSYVDSFLEQRAIWTMCKACGLDPETRPTTESPEKEKVNFIMQLLFRISGIMGELGSDSYLRRLPGNGIEEVLGPKDRAVYGMDGSVTEAWRGALNKYSSEHGNNAVDGLSPEAANFVQNLDYIKNMLIKYARHLVKWLQSFQNYDYDKNDLVMSLTGSRAEFEKAKGLLNPYVEMVPLVLGIAGSDILSGPGGRQSDEYRLAATYVNRLQREIGVNVFSPSAIDTAIRYAKDSYSGREEMLDYATRELDEASASDWSTLLEWSAIRFLMSEIGEKGNLIPPGTPGATAEGDGEAPAETESGHADDSAEILKKLEEYRQVLADKPKFLKRDAWLRQKGIDPAEYDYLEQKAQGNDVEDPNAEPPEEALRVIDYSPVQISNWLKNDYARSGKYGEMIVLMLALSHLCSLSHDTDMGSMSAFQEDSVNENAHDASMRRLLRLTDAMAEYGSDLVGRVIGDLVGDGGESLSALLKIIGSDEPLTLDELDGFLAKEDGETREPRTEEEVAEELYQVIVQLSFTPFLTFNGID